MQEVNKAIASYLGPVRSSAANRLRSILWTTLATYYGNKSAPAEGLITLIWGTWCEPMRKINQSGKVFGGLRLIGSVSKRSDFSFYPDHLHRVLRGQPAIGPFCQSALARQHLINALR